MERSIRFVVSTGRFLRSWSSAVVVHCALGPFERNKSKSNLWDVTFDIYIYIFCLNFRLSTYGNSFPKTFQELPVGPNVGGSRSWFLPKKEHRLRQDRILQRHFFAEQESAVLVRHMLEAGMLQWFFSIGIIRRKHVLKRNVLMNKSWSIHQSAETCWWLACLEKIVKPDFGGWLGNTPNPFADKNCTWKTSLPADFTKSCNCRFQLSFHIIRYHQSSIICSCWFAVPFPFRSLYYAFFVADGASAAPCWSLPWIPNTRLLQVTKLSGLAGR